LQLTQKNFLGTPLTLLNNAQLLTPIEEEKICWRDWAYLLEANLLPNHLSHSFPNRLVYEKPAFIKNERNLIEFGRQWRVYDCEELLGLPDRRDVDPWRSIHAQIHLTTLCINGRGQCGPYPPAFL
jgi:hypothetical protein